MNDFKENYSDDEYDQAVYNAAKQEFYDRYILDDQLCYEETRETTAKPACWPKTCADVGKQCGEWRCSRVWSVSS